MGLASARSVVPSERSEPGLFDGRLVLDRGLRVLRGRSHAPLGMTFPRWADSADSACDPRAAEVPPLRRSILRLSVAPSLRLSA